MYRIYCSHKRTFRSVRPAVGRYAKDADNDSMDDFAAKTHR